MDEEQSTTTSKTAPRDQDHAAGDFTTAHDSSNGSYFLKCRLASRNALASAGRDQSLVILGGASSRLLLSKVNVGLAGAGEYSWDGAG